MAGVGGKQNRTNSHAVPTEHSFDSSQSLDVTTPVQEQPGVTGNTKRPSRMDNNSTGGTAPNVNEQLCEKRFLKIGQIHPTVFTRACNLLNIHQVQGGDWQGLAGELGFNVTDVMIFEGQNNPARSMLTHWNSDSNNYLDHLVEALQRIRRQDVAGLFQGEIAKKGASCNCEECGSIQ